MRFAPGIAVTLARATRISHAGWRRRLTAVAAPAVLGSAVLAACTAQATPNASPLPTSRTSPSPSAATTTPDATATQVGRLTLPAPVATDRIAISYTVTVDVQAGQSGRLVVVVTNLTQEMVPELVLRWPTAVRNTIFLAPFEPSQQRIREGGPPLVQDWTRWVDGPGEHPVRWVDGIFPGRDRQEQPVNCGECARASDSTWHGAQIGRAHV